MPFFIAPPPQFDISKLIDGLKNLNEKIADTIHNFTDSFKRSQEQPPQDRTARGRKINLSIPFTKEPPKRAGAVKKYSVFLKRLRRILRSLSLFALIAVTECRCCARHIEPEVNLNPLLSMPA